ncbi:unnamed protein product [Ectocarpus sp. 12 AP-2014]
MQRQVHRPFLHDQVRGGDGFRPDLLHAAGAERGTRSHGGLHRLQRGSGQQQDGVYPHHGASGKLTEMPQYARPHVGAGPHHHTAAQHHRESRWQVVIVSVSHSSFSRSLARDGSTLESGTRSSRASDSLVDLVCHLLPLAVSKGKAVERNRTTSWKVVMEGWGLSWDVMGSVEQKDTVRNGTASNGTLPRHERTEMSWKVAETPWKIAETSWKDTERSRIKRERMRNGTGSISPENACVGVWACGK